MANLIDYTQYVGKVFTKLTVLSTTSFKKEGTKKTIPYAFCRCECGFEKYIKAWSVITGRLKSCGCIVYEVNRDRATHGLAIKGAEHPMYKIWEAMKARCYNPNNKFYSYYGGRGITVCDRWLEKETGVVNFISDMGPRPTPNHSVDRENNEKGYGPDNCRWATKKEQQSNTRANVWIEYNGEIKTVSQWAEITGINKKTISYRQKEGWGSEEIFRTPSHDRIKK